ncbi:MerR family transcriptional regulator [Phototrophicus methaneseepsis]|uniref:MerR family transcriptional regulator n=1 Tax=Phototrophicus methaneseepsis TaxID=2710758 RepID=A0A7S8EAS4_9CHLR|nr:MerR family transcriptional regulator [Phototrophicus methaneseepsis]QPC83419.1 MerR family transcriptional regulator [Phototrophicus methaneseepsis]
MSETTYSIKEVSEQVGWSIHMLRYYEKEGLLPPIARDDKGYRCYSEANLGLILFLERLRMTGMGISQMRVYVQLYQDRHIDEKALLPERIKLLRDHRESVLAQIDVLRHNLEAIEYKIELYETELEELENHGEPQTT